MNKNFLKAFMVAGLFGCVQSWAVPADPTPHRITQPDGSVVTLRQVGDEYFNCWLTSDGAPVLQKSDGFFYFVGSDGNVTDIAVTANGGERSRAGLNIDKDAAYSALRDKMLASNPRWNWHQEESKRFASNIKSRISDSKWDNTDQHDIRAIPTDGERKVLVILVNFSDMKFSDPNPKKSFNDMLNKPGYDREGATGSAYDFYYASSDGIYRPSFDVYGPVTLPRSYAYYGQNITTIDDNAEQMIVDAVNMLDGQINYADYDTNGDGRVDNVYVFYAGRGEASGGTADTVWPHAYNLEAKSMQVTHDGVIISRYACSNEIVSEKFTGIGTFCHEFAHVLGLPDLYDTANNGSVSSCFTPGEFSAMDVGPYNNGGKTPPLFSSYERYALEWLKPDEFEGTGQIQLMPLAAKNKAYIVRDPNKPTEYFLFENRQKIGWDEYIPAHGMLVWHIDFNSSIWNYNRPNNTPGHQCIDIVEADDVRTSGSIEGDTFPGSSEIYEFRYGGTPSFTNWSNNSMRHDITDIQESHDGIVTFNVWVSGGNEVPVDYLASPVPVVTASTSDSFSVRWNAVDGADGYYVNVFDNSDFSSEKLGDPLDGWSFKDVADATSVDVNNLEAEHSYGISVYAYSSDKASPYAPAVAVTTKGETLDSSTPVAYVEDEDNAAGSVTVAWDNVNGADSYLVTVATREDGEVVSSDMQSFDNKEYPDDWYFMASFDNDYFGKSAPSLKFSLADDCVETGYYDQPVKQVSFWVRSRLNDGKSYIDVYGYDENQNPCYIGRESGFTSEADTRTVVMPDGIHQVMLYFYRSSVDAVINVDDIDVQLTSGPKYTPFGNYNDFSVVGNSLKVDGLSVDTDYVVFVKAKKGTEVSKASKVVTFNLSNSSSVIDNVKGESAPILSLNNGMLRVAQADAMFDIYNLDGRVLAKGAKNGYQLSDRGVYIVRMNDKTYKICW